MNHDITLLIVRAENAGTAKESGEAALQAYLLAKEENDKATSLMSRAKGLLEEAMRRGDIEKVEIKDGSAAYNEPFTRVRYDTKALDALIKSDDNVARLLKPHRRVVRTDPTLRVTRKAATDAVE